jgi:[protein-PII] uridylyltransferase
MRTTAFYTVDEHTFVLIDTLHDLESRADGGLRMDNRRVDEWASRFGGCLRELPHPGCCILSLCCMTRGRGAARGTMRGESVADGGECAGAAGAGCVRERTGAGVDSNHLEMSAALRRDIFDTETVRAFAGKVQTPEVLRMLTLFTYADINAVHPDALTPWKAENLWRLYIATANYLDRSVDDGARGISQRGERAGASGNGVAAGAEGGGGGVS